MSRRSLLTRPAGRAAGLASIIVPCLILTACTSAETNPGHLRALPALVRLPLATSMTSAAGTTWAIVDMGGSVAQGKNVWELFARPDRSARWRLATPGHIASNGGLVASFAGSGPGAAAGFVRNQVIASSPLTSTADSGADWSPGQEVPGGLAHVPGALAASRGGRELALNAAEQVLLTSGGASWTTLTDMASLAATAAGRSCGLTAITAVTLTAAGAPLLAGNCRKAGVAGVFEQDGRSWRLASVPMPAGRPSAASPAATSAASAAEVAALSLVTSGDRTTAVLRYGPATAGKLVAVRRNPAGRWTISRTLAIGAASVQSVAVWPDGAAAVVLSGRRAALLRSHGASWQQLRDLPARAAALATGPAGELEALAPQNQTLRVWVLRQQRWQLSQTSRVASAHL